jgi:mRNA-degrading endonuclease toxin of MazEF toxin-antitoxin module
VPSRGEVWLVDLGMIQKVRPALVLNRPFKDEDRALITVIPHTRRAQLARPVGQNRNLTCTPRSNVVENSLAMLRERESHNSPTTHPATSARAFAACV